MATSILVDPSIDSPTMTFAARLRWLDSAGEVHTQPLSNGATTIGGGPRCQVRLDAKNARPLHCVIERTVEGATVRRWSSDTHLNGRSFTKSPLHAGDRLNIAGVELWVENESAVATELSEEAPPSATNKLELVEPREPATTVEQAAGVDRLRSSLQTTRSRVRSLLAALRFDRASLKRTTDRLTSVSDNRNEAAHQLLLTTTQLHDCRTDLEQVRAELAIMVIDRDENLRLFEIAKAEVDELEQEIAGLRADRDSLVENQQHWIEQREELVSTVALFHQAVEASATAFPEPALIEPSNDTDTPSPSSEALEALDTSVSPTSTFDEGAEPAASGSSAMKDGAAWEAETSSPSVEPESTPAVSDDPWAGTWAIESQDAVPDEPELEETEDEAASEDSQATAAWLASFQSPSPAQETMNDAGLTTPTVDKAPAPESLDAPACNSSENVDELVIDQPAEEAPEAGISFGVDKPISEAEPTQPEPVADCAPAPAETSVAMPKSVEDLIPDDQPSSEAPVSFFDQFAGSLPQDDPAPLPHTADQNLAPPASSQLSPSSGESPSPSGTDEESIEDYMAKLMQRMRGDDAPPPAEPEVASVTPVPAAEDPAPAEEPTPPEPPSEPAAPLTSLDELRSGPAPEQGHDMSSLRELANESARSAIGVSQAKQNKEKAIANLTISVMAMGCGGFLAATAPSLISGQLFGGVVAFGWALYWFWRTYSHLRAAAYNKKLFPVETPATPAPAEPELPIAPE